MVLPYTKAPHQGVHGSQYADSPHAALLIDFDNVTLGMRSDMSKDLKALLESDVIAGKVSVRRAYADWRRYPQYIVPLSEASVDLIFAPAYGSNKKNATDIRMAIDGMELVFVRPEIGTFILLTGDSDFSSLVLKLKEYGKYVIGVGMQESSSDILVQNCDEYYSYTSITGLQKSSNLERVRRNPWNLVTVAIDKMVQRGDVMRSDRLKQVMREIDPGFSEGEIGFSKFSKFLTEAQKRGLVQLAKADAGQFEISKPSNGASPGANVAGRATEDAPRQGVGGRGRRRRGGERGRSGRRGGNGIADDGASQASSETGRSAQAVKPARRETAAPNAPAAPARQRRQPTRLKAAAGRAPRPPRTERADRPSSPAVAASAEARGSRPGAAHSPRPAQPPRPHSTSTQPDKLPAPRTVVEEIGPEGGPGGQLAVAANGRPLRGGTTRRRSADAPADPFAAPTARPRATREASKRRTKQPARAGKEPARSAGTRDSTRPAFTPKTSGRAQAQAVESKDPGPPAKQGRGEPVKEPKRAAPTPSGRSESAQTQVGAEARGFDARELKLPTERAAIRRYLANRYRGVGEKTAEALVAKFGTEVFRVLAEEPGSLKGVIPPKRAEQLLEAWKTDYERRKR